MAALIEQLEGGLREGGASLQALPSRAVVDELESMGSDGSFELGASLSSSPIVLGLAPTLAVATSAGDRPAEAAGSLVLARPPGDDADGHATSLSTRRTFAAGLSAKTLGVMVSELDRLERRRGRVQRLGASLAWSTRDLEVHVDATATGMELLVWRRLDRRRRRRTAGWMLFGAWLGSLFIGAVAGSELLELIGLANLMPLFVIGSLLGGAAMGYRKAQRRHVRSLPSEQERIEFVADRMVTLAGADELPALDEGELQASSPKRRGPRAWGPFEGHHARRGLPPWRR